jgi:signal transduction histidine kinase
MGVGASWNPIWTLPVQTLRGRTAILVLVEYAGGVTQISNLGHREADVHGLVAAERLRIARELHDVVSYGFATISLQAGIAAHIAETQPEQAVEALQVIRDASRDVLGELRAILGQLRADDGSAEPARGIGRLSALVEQTTRAGMEVSVRVVGRPRPVPVELDIAVYRIVQEALTNVLRHAPGAAARVLVTYEPRGVRVTIENDGSIGRAGPSEGSGYGIVGMRERATALGGELDASSLPDGGFCVHAHLPIGRR